MNRHFSRQCTAEVHLRAAGLNNFDDFLSKGLNKHTFYVLIRKSLRAVTLNPERLIKCEATVYENLKACVSGWKQNSASEIIGPHFKNCHRTSWPRDKH